MMSPATILNIREPWVQEFLWQHLVPGDIRSDYTKLDAIKYVESQVYAGAEFLYGNREVIMRCVVQNEYVIEPHIMGNGHYFRSTMEAGIDYAAKNTAFERVVVWTHHKVIGRILNRCGFTLAGTLTKYHWTPDGAADLMSYVREIR